MANYRLDRIDCTSAAGTSTSRSATRPPTSIWRRGITPPASMSTPMSPARRPDDPQGDPWRRGHVLLRGNAFAEPGDVHRAQATTTLPGVPVDAVPSLLSLAPGRYVIAERRQGRRRALASAPVSCNGADRATTKPFPVDIRSGESVVCTFVDSFVPRGSISLAKITEGGVGTASFVVTPATGPPTPHLQNATTTSPGWRPMPSPDPGRRHRSPSPRHLSHSRTASPQLHRRLGPDHGRVQRSGDPLRSRDGDHGADPQVPHVHCVFTNSFSTTPKPPVPPNPTPVPPVPPLPATPAPTYQIADLLVTKVASAPVVTRGNVIGFRITVKNRGPDTAQLVVLTDQPRAAPTVVAVHTTAGGCHHRGRLTVCPLGTLKRGHSVTITIRTRVKTHATSFVNRAVVGTSTLEQTLANNVASAQVTVVGPPRPVVGCPARPRATHNRPYRLLKPATPAPPPDAP